VQGRIGLDRKQVLGPHAAGLGDAAQIIADQIHDHQIFGAVLGDAASAARSRASSPRRARCALHRPGAYPPICRSQKQFRRQAENLPCRYHPQTRNAAPLAARKLFVQSARIAQRRQNRRENSDWPDRCRPPRWPPLTARNAGHRPPHPIPAAAARHRRGFSRQERPLRGHPRTARHRPRIACKGPASGGIRGASRGSSA
jgi:hypothetical protein